MQATSFKPAVGKNFQRGHARKTQILVLVVIVTNVLGNVSLSHGMHQVGRIVSASPLDYLRAFAHPGMKRKAEVENVRPRTFPKMVAQVVRNPLVLGGFAALAVSFFALLSLLSISSVSFAVPATAISYLLETLLAKYILGEDVRLRRWAAATLVALGVVMLSF